MSHKARTQPPRRPEQKPALSDQRFHELLQQASEKFREAETPSVPTRDRNEVIAEILATMKTHGLTIEDLSD